MNVYECFGVCAGGITGFQDYISFKICTISALTTASSFIQPAILATFSRATSVCVNMYTCMCACVNYVYANVSGVVRFNRRTKVLRQNKRNATNKQAGEERNSKRLRRALTKVANRELRSIFRVAVAQVYH